MYKQFGVYWIPVHTIGNQTRKPILKEFQVFFEIVTCFWKGCMRVMFFCWTGFQASLKILFEFGCEAFQC